MKNLLGQIWELYFIKNTPIHYIVMIKGSNGSSNINEIIRASLNSIFFFYKKISHVPKAPKSTKRHKNATKKKHKTQLSEQKEKKRLKNIWVEKSNLFAYFFFFFFFKFIKKIEKKKMKSLYNVMYQILMFHKPLQVRTCVPAWTGLWGHKLKLHVNLIKIS